MENKKSGSFWKCTAFLFLGVILGFFIAPIKKGISCGNNNGNHNTFSDNETSIKSDECLENEE